MEVCEVCGAFLIVGDAQSRVDDHLMGKQHMGYAKIKSTVEELKVTGLHMSFLKPLYVVQSSDSVTRKNRKYSYIIFRGGGKKISFFTAESFLFFLNQ